MITHAQAEAARKAPLGLHVAQPQSSVAPWFQEEVRQELEKRFGSEQVHEAGLRVDTTLDMDLQQTANRAVNDGLAAYERRHGWKGNLENVVANGLATGIDAATTLEDYRHPDWAFASGPGDYVHALVTRVLPKQIYIRVGAPGQPGSDAILLQPDWQWTGQRSAEALVKPGDILYVHLAAAMEGTSRRATLEQDSGAQGALMAIDNTSGDVLSQFALVLRLRHAPGKLPFGRSQTFVRAIISPALRVPAEKVVAEAQSVVALSRESRQAINVVTKPGRLGAANGGDWQLPSGRGCEGCGRHRISPIAFHAARVCVASPFVQNFRAGALVGGETRTRTKVPPPLRR